LYIKVKDFYWGRVAKGEGQQEGSPGEVRARKPPWLLTWIRLQPLTASPTLPFLPWLWPDWVSFTERQDCVAED
jgi:hypothetical protein